jgi:hypothetical protein
VRLASADAGDLSADPNNLAGLAEPAAPIVVITVAVELAEGVRVKRRTVIRLVVDAARQPFQFLDQD